MLPKTVNSSASNTYTKMPKRLGTIGPYEEYTRTTTPTVYNTSSTTTVHYHTVGDTNMENSMYQIIDENQIHEHHTYTYTNIFHGTFKDNAKRKLKI